MRINRKAMIGFPIKLTVAFLILSVAVPALSGMVGHMNDTADTQAASHEADRVSAAISTAYYSGVGSIRTVDVSLKSGASLQIGGEGSKSYSIGVLLNDVEKTRVYMQRPLVKINGDGIVVHNDATICIKCIKMGNGCGVEVSLR